MGFFKNLSHNCDNNFGLRKIYPMSTYMWHFHQLSQTCDKKIGLTKFSRNFPKMKNAENIRETYKTLNYISRLLPKGFPNVFRQENFLEIFQKWKMLKTFGKHIKLSVTTLGCCLKVFPTFFGIFRTISLVQIWESEGGMVWPSVV